MAVDSDVYCTGTAGPGRPATSDSDKISVQVWLDVRSFIDAAAEVTGATAAGDDITTLIPVLATLRVPSLVRATMWLRARMLSI